MTPSNTHSPSAACKDIQSNGVYQDLRAVIAPSVLAADFSILGDECRKVVEAGAEWIHLDIMDGHFVPNLSFGFPVIKSLSKFLSTLKSNPDGVLSVVKDVHIMVTDPVQWVESLSECGADHVTFHIEACPTREYAIDCARAFRKRGMTVGIAVKPKTNVDECLSILEETDDLFSLLLVMSVEPGFGGQKFDPSVLEKCSKARKLFPNINIQLDGGLNIETTVLGAQAGANVIVAGTSVFAAKDPAGAIRSMKESINKHCIANHTG